MGQKREDKTSKILISDTNLEWFEAKHPIVSNKEIEFNKTLSANTSPKCGSTLLIKNGHLTNGLRRYLCKSCHYRFNILTNTIFDNRKIPISEWIEYLLCLFKFQSISTSSKDNKNAFSTGRYWIHKVFLVLEGIQDSVVLSGRVYFDETFVKLSKSKRIKKNGHYLRGISSNLLCIAVAVTSSSLYIKYEGVSKPSIKSTLATMKGHIEKESTLIHDGEHSHDSLIKEYKLKDEAHKAWGTKYDIKDDPLELVNDVHTLLKRFLNSHSGYKKEELQNWLNLFWFIYGSR